jgi:hypothetical protein
MSADELRAIASGVETRFTAEFVASCKELAVKAAEIGKTEVVVRIRLSAVMELQVREQASKHYDPFCGRPNVATLESHVWALVRRMADAVSAEFPGCTVRPWNQDEYGQRDVLAMKISWGTRHDD